MAALGLAVLLSLLAAFTDSAPAGSTCDLSVTPPAATVKVGNDVTFVCNATCLGGLSRDQLFWLDGQMQRVPFTGAERVNAVSYNRWSVSRLLVQRAQVSDSGVYTCEVQQGRRLLQFFVKLNVQDDSPAVLEDRGPTRGDIRARPEIFFPPVRPARAARGQRLGEAVAASGVILDLDEAEKDDAVEQPDRSWRRRRRRHAGGPSSPAGTSDSTAMTDSTSPNTVDSASDNSTAGVAATGQNSGASASAPAPGVDTANSTWANMSQNTDISDSSPWPSSRESHPSTFSTASVANKAAAFDANANDTSAGTADSNITAQANASEIVASSTPHIPVRPVTGSSPLTVSSTTTKVPTGTLSPSTSSTTTTATPTTKASSTTKATSTTTSQASNDAGHAGTVDASSGSGEESDFGRYGLLAFGLTLGIAFLLLYALLLVIFVPRCCKKRGKHTINSDVKDERGSHEDKNDAILLGERPHKPRAPLTSATGLNGEFFTAVDLEDDGKDHGKKDKPWEEGKGTRKDNESGDGKGEKDDKKNKPDTFVSTFTVGRLSQSNQGSSTSQPNSPTTADVTSGKPPNMATTTATTATHQPEGKTGAGPQDVMVTSTPAVSDDDDDRASRGRAGKGEPDTHETSSMSSDEGESSSSPSTSSSDKEMPPDRQPLPNDLGGGENFSLMPDIQFTLAAPVKPTDV